MEQLCLAESTRPRMTLEEQMERIKRHQQACLREKKKGLNIIGISDLSPSQSPALVRENPFKLLQVGPHIQSLSVEHKQSSVSIIISGT